MAARRERYWDSSARTRGFRRTYDQPICRRLTSRSFPPRLCSVEDMANRLLADPDALSEPRFASNFVKHRKELITHLDTWYHKHANSRP